MRYFFVFFIAAFLLVGCSDKNIELKGTVSGANYGKVMISNADKEVIYQADITSGQFSISKRPMSEGGFYQLLFLIGSSTSKRNEIYLEPGSTYTIDADAKNIDDYPHIVSTSKNQTELSAYYDLLTAAKKSARKKVMEYDSLMRALDDVVLSFEERNTRLQQLRNKQLDANNVDMVAVFDAFVKKHPDSEIAPHLMLNTEYQQNPVGYYEVFKKLSEDVKKSEEGEQLEQKLKQLTRLAAGGDAPAIEGTTPEGKTIDVKTLNKKVIIIDFWRALNSQSLRDHEQMAKKMLPRYKDKGLEVVSVSFDDNREKWLEYIKRSDMTWPQLSDLKGDNSPNAANWAITKIPTYYILDGEGRIIKRCLDYYELEVAVIDYMAKH